MVQIAPMAMITQHKCRVGAVLPGSHEGLSLACLTLSSAQPLPAASIERHPCQVFSLSLLGNQLITSCLPARGACALVLFTGAPKTV